MIKTIVLVLAVSSLASCGGDSAPDGYQTALDEATAAQGQAVSLAAASPCDTVQQCGVLRLTDPVGHCAVPSYRPYSLVSPTADAASAAASNERDLAQLAVTLSPATPCLQLVVAPPRAVCAANTCQAAPPQ